MKKQQRILLCLGSALLLASASALCAQAAGAGWVSENGTWRYQEASGNYASNAWKTSGGSSYYLDGNGNMAVSQWIDDTYYVNESGMMVTNAWIHLTEATGQKPAGWYYVASSGKLKKDGWETINGNKYSFDDDGRMRTGWYYEDDNIYYLGGEDQGYTKTGWRCLDFDEENKPEEGEISENRSSASDTAKWFYFSDSGRAERAKDKSYAAKTIGNNKYYFDEDGVMQTGWIAIEDSAESGDTTGISRFVYLGGENDGIMAKDKWLQLDTHPGDSDDGDEIAEGSSDEEPVEGDSNWYYFESDGTPAYLNSKASNMSRATVKAGGSSYFFNQYGLLQTGMIRFVNADGEEFLAYFDESSSSYGKMAVGKKNNLNAGGDTDTYYFTESGSNKGAGYNGNKDGYLYYQGRLLRADDDYQVFEVKNRLYLVNESGRIQTDNKNYKVGGSYMYKVSGSSIYFIDDDKETTGKVESSDAETLPDVSFDKEYTFN